jgi:hypothetical protein
MKRGGRGRRRESRRPVKRAACQRKKPPILGNRRPPPFARGNPRPTIGTGEGRRSNPVIVSVAVVVGVVGPLIVAVHVNGNATVGVIERGGFAGKGTDRIHTRRSVTYVPGLYPHQSSSLSITSTVASHDSSHVLGLSTGLSDLLGKVRIGEPGGREPLVLVCTAAPGSPIRTAAPQDPMPPQPSCLPQSGLTTPRLPVIPPVRLARSPMDGGEGVVRESPQAKPEGGDVEVDQQRGPEPSQAEVGQSLCRVDGQEAFDDLQLDQDFRVHHQVHPISAVERQPLVRERDRDLATKGDTSKGQLVAKARLVGRFQKPGTKPAMNLDAGSDHGVGAVGELGEFFAAP